jgi:hypothetical protein
MVVFFFAAIKKLVLCVSLLRIMMYSKDIRGFSRGLCLESTSKIRVMDGVLFFLFLFLFLFFLFI